MAAKHRECMEVFAGQTLDFLCGKIRDGLLFGLQSRMAREHAVGFEGLLPGLRASSLEQVPLHFAEHHGDRLRHVRRLRGEFGLVVDLLLGVVPHRVGRLATNARVGDQLQSCQVGLDPLARFAARDSVARYGHDVGVAPVYGVAQVQLGALRTPLVNAKRRRSRSLIWHDRRRCRGLRRSRTGLSL